MSEGGYENQVSAVVAKLLFARQSGVMGQAVFWLVNRTDITSHTIAGVSGIHEDRTIELGGDSDPHEGSPRNSVSIKYPNCC